MVPYTYGGDNLSWSIYQLVASQNEPVPEGSNYNDYVHQFTAEELSAIGSSVGTWKNVLVHEFGGHCFGRLLDEYWYTSFYTSQVAIDSHSWPVPFGLNVSGFYETVPWDYLLTNLEDLVASDGNYARIGRYQGGGVMVFNRWRSEIISCMIDNRSYFSAWQRMLIVKRIMERTGMEFSNDSFFTKDVTTDPIRDVVSNPVLGIDPTRPVHAVPLLPPPVLTEE